MFLPRLEAHFVRSRHVSLCLDPDEVYHLLLLSLFVVFCSSANISEVIRHLANAAFDVWRDGKQAFDILSLAAIEFVEEGHNATMDPQSPTPFSKIGSRPASTTLFSKPFLKHVTLIDLLSR